MLKHAIILAGGSGTRLMPLTQDRPKALVEVDGLTLIEHQIKWLRSNGIENIHISCSQKWLEMIKQKLGEGIDAVNDAKRPSTQGIKAFTVKYYPETEAADTGGGLKIVLDNANINERFLLCNVDDLNDIDISEMEKVQGNVMSLHRFRSQFGVPKTNGEFIIDFLQKPETDFWVNEGVYIFEPGIKEMLTEKCNMEREVFPKLAASHKLRFYRHKGFWHTVNTVKDVTEFKKIIDDRD